MKVYKLTIDDDLELGMDAISLVEFPAVEVDFQCFSKEQRMDFTSFNDEKHEITGVVCLADTPIYRNNPTFGEHYIIFEKDMIRKMVHRYFKNGLGNQVNIEHQGPMIDGLTMIESYIVDNERNIVPSMFKSIPEGSWVCTFKVENDEVWNEIKEKHSLKGFSLQGYFQYGDEVKLSKSTNDYENWIDEILNS